MSSRSADLARHLLDSGARALEHAATLVEHQPELAIITFAIGVELSLKARLAHEHWFLIVEGKPKVAANAWADLRAGKLRTLGAAAVEQVLASLVPEQEAHVFARSRNAFAAVKEIRDRAVHFGLMLEAEAHAPAALAAVQLRAWHALQFYADAWPVPLESMASHRWKQIESALARLKAYLETLAEELIPYLQDTQAEGGAVGSCPACKLVGLVRHKDELVAAPMMTRCTVCQFLVLAVTGACPSCDKQVAASLGGEGPKFQVRCATCGHSGEYERLGSVEVTPQNEGIDRHGEPIGQRWPRCGSCMFGEPLTQLDVAGTEWFACSSCGDHWSDGWTRVETCGNCHDTWLGVDLEESAVSGCPRCEDEAQERWERD